MGINIVTVSEAAELLGISGEAVRKMVKAGRLAVVGTAGRALLLDPVSVQRVLNAGRRQGRALEPRMAWGALALLSGEPAPWLTPAELTRLQQRLPGLSPEDVHLVARKRAVTHRLRGIRRVVELLQPRLTPTGASALAYEDVAERFGLAAGRGEGIEGYALPGDAEKLKKALGLVEDPRGNIVIHEAAFTEAFTQPLAPLAAIAADLTDSLGTRERSAGRRVLDELLTGFTDAGASTSLGQARRKARAIAKSAMGTMSLEGQGVPPESFGHLYQRALRSELGKL